MSRYQYTVKLEEIRTRFPMTYPSIKDKEIVYLDPDDMNMYFNANYGLMPLGVNEEVLGTSYSTYSEEMNEAFSGDTIPYTVLSSWFKEFNDYYNLLYSEECRTSYSSATDYYTSQYGEDGPDLTTYQEMDERYRIHGGDKFYKWLSDYYFIHVDLRQEYDESLGIEYLQWMEYINNLPSYILTYAAARQLYGNLKKLDGLYGDKDCGELEDCCDCVDYKKVGGRILLNVLNTWLSGANSRIKAINDKIKPFEEQTVTIEDECDTEDGTKKTREVKKINLLVPNIAFNININRKLENLGNYVSFSKEFVPGKEYSGGTVCTYEGVVYINTGNTYTSQEFDTTKWVNYYDYYMNNLDADDPEKETLGEINDISGRTSSNLDMFLTKKVTVDNIGNTMPGFFEPNQDSKFAQPAENSILGLMYEPGMFVTRVVVDEENKICVGDVLYSIKIYHKDLYGKMIAVKDCYYGTNVLEAIASSITTAKANENYVEGIYADFTYYLNATYVLGESSIAQLYTTDAVRCVDHCVLEEKTYPYNLSQTYSYPIRYYDVIKDMETVYSDTAQEDINVYMCDYLIKPKNFGSNGRVASPMLRREVLLGFTGPEKVQNNIYIDRGYATVLDKHLRMGEIRDFDDLENYGNGIFPLFDINEDIV